MALFFLSLLLHVEGPQSNGWSFWLLKTWRGGSHWNGSLFIAFLCVVWFSWLKGIIMQLLLRIYVDSFAEEKEEKLKITEMSEFRKQGVTILSGKVVCICMIFFILSCVIQNCSQFISFHSFGFDCCSVCSKSFPFFICTLFAYTFIKFCWFKDWKVWGIERKVSVLASEGWSLSLQSRRPINLRHSQWWQSSFCLPVYGSTELLP